MPRFNWALRNVAPIEKRDFDLSKNVPDCSVCKVSIYTSALKFQRGKELCLIAVTQSDKRTNIVITYSVK